MKFKPCIDLHNGMVKQIVGSTLSTSIDVAPTENFVATMPASFYATKYKNDDLKGGHIIMLGPGCETAALEALQSFPNGMQLGGIVPIRTIVLIILR
jgi:phosphoribosylformimino-5-aminoimidazole carboxamide ribotide isomerase